MDLLLPKFGLFVWTVLAFLVLLFLLTKFAWKPILKSVNDRTDAIQEALDQAKLARKEIERLKIENEQNLKQAKADRDAVLKEAREMKDKIIAEAKDTAKVESDRMIENTKNVIQNEKLAAITDIKNQMAQLSIDIAEKVLKNQLSAKDEQEKLVQNLIKEAKLN